MQPRRVEPKRDLKISPSKRPHLLKRRSSLSEGRQQHRAWTISIERERACARLSAELLLSVQLCRSRLTFQLCLLEVFPPSDYHSHTLSINTVEAAYTYLPDPMLMCSVAATYLYLPALMLWAAYFRFY